MELRRAPTLTIAALLRAGLGLIFSLLAIRLVGADSFGVFSLIWALCAAVLAMYTGLNTVLVGRVVAARMTGTAGAWVAPGLLLTTIMVVALVSVAGLVAVQELLAGNVRLAALYCTLMLACQVCTQFSCATLEGLGQVARAAILPILGTLAIVAVLVLSLVAGWPVRDLRDLLILSASAYALEATASLALVWLNRRAFHPLRLRRPNVVSLVVGGASTQAANIVMFLLDPLSKGVLALNLGPGSVAVFDLSMKVGWGLLSVMSAFSRLFLQIPSSEQSRRIALLGLAANMTWAPAALVGAICVSVLPPLLSAWLRIDQAQLGLGMALAVTTCMLMTAASAGYISLIAFHDLAFIFRNQMILGLANVLAAPLLVPVIGFAGAFLGALAGTVVNVVLISRRLRQHMPAFGGFGSLAKSLRGRLTGAIAVFGIAWVAAVSPSMLSLSVVASLAASALLLREPLARATWQQLSGGRAW